MGRYFALYQQSAHAQARFPGWRWSTRSSKCSAATLVSAPPRSASMSARAARTSASATTSPCSSPPFQRRPSRSRLRVKDEEEPPDHGELHHPRPAGPHLPAAIQAPGARLLLPAADLPRRRRIGAPPRGLLHHPVQRRPRIAAPHARSRGQFQHDSRASSRSSSTVGSIRPSTAGIPAIITSMPPAARTT